MRIFLITIINYNKITNNTFISMEFFKVFFKVDKYFLKEKSNYS